MNEANLFDEREMAMDWLQIAANIAQVLSVIWALIFGGKLIHDVVKSILNRTKMRVVLTITNILLAAILLVLVSPHATLLSQEYACGIQR